jgi:hypothetical protein
MTIVVVSSSQSELLNCYPASDDIDVPSILEFREEYEIYTYVQEDNNVSQIKVDILALDSIPHKLRLTSNWNVTWYQITTYLDEAGTERPYFYKVIANTSWSELNWRYDWGVGEIIGNHTDMVAFKAVGTVEIVSEGGVVLEMVSNDGMLVSLNGNILKPSMWFPHEKMNVENHVFLSPGFYDVEVLWFEKDGEAFSEFKMYPIGWKIQETIHLSRRLPELDSKDAPYLKYNATWTPNLLLGQYYLFNWILEDAKGNFDEKTTYAHISIPIDGYFTINGVVVQTSTLTIPESYVEFWFYSTSQGAEINSVFVELSNDEGLLSDVCIVLNEIEPNLVWYGNYTLPTEGEYTITGVFLSIRDEEWVKMSINIIYHSELSPRVFHLITNGVIILSIMVVGYVLFSIRQRLKVKTADS